MKTKILFALFVAVILAGVITKSEENSANYVENISRIKCELSVKDKKYQLALDWSYEFEHWSGGRAPSIIKNLNYILTDLQTGEDKREIFTTRFGMDSISVDTENLEFSVNSSYPTRVGNRFTNFSAVFTDEGELLLQSLVISSGLERWSCKPMAKICRSEPEYEEVIEIIPEVSSCTKK